VVAPDLSWIYLQHTDDIGHRFGNSKQMEQAIGYLDNQMGTIWNAIQYREQTFKEDWLFIITTDHGRDAAAGKNHGGQSDAERTTWMIANNKNTNAYFQQNIPAIVDILPTMARFQKIKIPTRNEYELDGVPIIGPVSLSHPTIEKKEDSLIIHWNAYEQNTNVKILISYTNLFKEGKVDAYEKLGSIRVKEKRFAFKLPLNTSFAKIILVGKHNSINTQWANRVQVIK
jgi:hypothetical protein